LIVVVLAASAFAIVRVASTGEEVATVVLSVPVLAITAATFWLTTPKRAKLVVIRQDELGLDDLVFFIYDEGEWGQVPRDYLLQLHVAVCNVGDRKAVLSGLEIRGFAREDRKTVHLPDAPQVIAAHQYHWQSGWVDGQPHYQSIEHPPPFVLDAGDVITLRFRCRCAIDWSHSNPDALRRYCEPLGSPIRRAFGEMTWRRGDHLERETFQVEIRATQQEQYLDAVRALTDNFTRAPNVPHRPVPG
jgi:hypothetical protein